MFIPTCVGTAFDYGVVPKIAHSKEVGRFICDSVIKETAMLLLNKNTPAVMPRNGVVSRFMERLRI